VSFDPAKLGLHDATLISITVHWIEGTAELTFRLAGQVEATVSALRLSGLMVPREQPWGRSVSVNSAVVTAASGGRQRLVVEMQSGDEIVAYAEEFRDSRTS
jgi:hypothetical protein